MPIEPEFTFRRWLIAISRSDPKRVHRLLETCVGLRRSAHEGRRNHYCHRGQRPHDADDDEHRERVSPRSSAAVVTQLHNFKNVYALCVRR